MSAIAEGLFSVTISFSHNPLPTSDIDKKSLKRVDMVIPQYPRLRGESKAGTLACKLAKEAYFGPELMKRCTPFGNRDLPALPSEELLQLKRTMLSLFLQYKQNAVEFESIWQKCIEAIRRVKGCVLARTDLICNIDFQYNIVIHVPMLLISCMLLLACIER